MAKARARAGTAEVVDGEIPVVGMREPCPCGSGKRYKVCHGKAAARAATTLVRRPFEGLPGECDWVALREIVPAATATIALVGPYAGRTVTVGTVLPMAWPAMVRGDGEIHLGLQTMSSSGDPSRDVGHALELALEAEPGTPVGVGTLPTAGPRLQDLVDVSVPFEVTVHDGFGFWLEGMAGIVDAADAEAAIEAANEGIVPTAKLTSIDAAYWCRVRDKVHLRWVVPHDEDVMIDALARLHAADAATVGEGSRYVGSFRADGLVVPVWDLAPGTEADAVEDPAANLARRLDDALADTSPLTEDQRRARSVIQSKQVTLR